MIDKKDKLLNKLVKKDYNNLLEELLATKNYDENVKSLLLSMSYKLETAYKDYENVKKNVLPKEEYMKKIFLIIQKKCEHIEFIKNENQSTKSLVDKENGQIKCYPIERILLYSISKMEKKEDIVKYENPVIKKSLTQMLNEGNAINTCEPIRDFNGFSWNTVTSDIENLMYNLVYQDLIILVGNDFLEKWINDNKFVINYLEKFENDIQEGYGEDLRKKIMTKLIKISILQFITLGDDYKAEAENEKLEIQKEFSKFENSSQYLIDLGNKKKQLGKKIKQIDQIINDKELLDIEYEKRNKKLPLEKKIFSMRVLKKIMQEEREKCLKKLEEYSHLMNPQVFLKTQEDLENYMEYFEVVDIDKENIQKILLELIIDLQKDILEAFKYKIDKAQEKHEIVNLIYEFRYFNQIPIIERKKISQVENIKENLEEIQKRLITKAIEKKVLVELSDIEKINVDVLKNLFTSTIISLEAVAIKVSKEKDFWRVCFFDEEIVEKTIDIEELLEKKDLKIRFNKNTKVFI